MTVIRRKFLSLLAVAPAAGPVAAKEAAQKMGLSAVTMAQGGAVDGVPVGGYGDSSAQSESDWVRDEMKEFWSDDARRQRWQSAKWAAKALDPDLAALRSVSPAWAYNMQRTRVLAAVEDERLSWLSKRAKKLGLSWLVGAS